MNNDVALSNNKIKKQAAYISLFVGIGMFLAKSIAYLLTNSSAVFSDAIESVVHVAATTMALVSIIYSAKPPDRKFLYGYGNIEYFSAGFEGLLIIIAAVTIIYYSILDIFVGQQIRSIDIGSIIVGTAGVVNLFLGFYLIKKGKNVNSIALIADGKHVLTDSYTSFGVIVGLILVAITGYTILDPIFALFVASNIIFTGVKLMKDSFGGLMNLTDQAMLDRITSILIKSKKDYYIDIHHLKFWKSAEKVYLEFHLTLPYYFSIEQAHNEEKYVEEMLLNEIEVTSISIHMDHCGSGLCKYCAFSACEKRFEQFTNPLEWNTSKMVAGPVADRYI